MSGSLIESDIVLFQEIMPNYIIEDDEFGAVVVHPVARARRIIARHREGVVHLSVPPHLSEGEVRQALDRLRPRLRKCSFEKRYLDEQFTMETLTFKVQVTRTPLTHIHLRLRDGILSLSVSERLDIRSEEVQQKLRSMIESAMRHEAKRIFPEYVKRLANQHGFQYSGVKINKSKTRWGSCNSQKSINLSYFCLLLPPHLLELIILHELCHTREMNHSERFWAELDRVTGHQARSLTQELKNYTTSF